MSDANHSANLADMHWRIENLILTGTVEEVMGDLARIRTGELTTIWISWLTLRAGNARTWWRPSTGEQVFSLCLSGGLATAVAPWPFTLMPTLATLLDEQVHHSVCPDGVVLSKSRTPARQQPPALRPHGSVPAQASRWVRRSSSARSWIALIYRIVDIPVFVGDIANTYRIALRLGRVFR
ncbi:phage baseplate assembly protein V [Acerihabitans sp. KWT182]|uniref:Phage baseplate assembly protein V n=1 Tax=Acerihabitans sp. KWT182 TaxID=3157919 RepID=A0AAU7Q8G5_9GAMM